jgi:arylsulfatase A-like enzyme
MVEVRLSAFDSREVSVKRKIVGPLVLLVVLFLPGLATIASTALAQEDQPQPNIVYIFTDDQDFRSLDYMPYVKSLLVDEGTTFPNYFLTDPVCCPSRTTMLTGMYPHNHKVRFNDQPGGGFEEFRQQGLERGSMPTALSNAGYRTALVGKYMNGYGAHAGYVPPGWSRWYAATTLEYFNYELSENGALVRYGKRAGDYLTDVLSRKARVFARDTKGPMFLYYSIRAPHAPFVPAPRHRSLFAEEGVPRVPSFNEADVSDKPAFIRTRPAYTPRQVAVQDNHYRKRLQMLQAADEAVRDLIATLTAKGEIENTYIFFTTDNGYMNGVHRYRAKGVPYEEAIRFPLIVRGPGVAKGKVDDRIVGNIDLLQTFAELAGKPLSSSGDGRSIVPLLHGGGTAWRDAILLESFSRDPSSNKNPSWIAIRLEDEIYVEYGNGDREYYDLKADPHQLDNAYDTLAEEATTRLHDRLIALTTCSGDGCRVADSDPNPPPAPANETGFGTLSNAEITADERGIADPESGRGEIDEGEEPELVNDGR